MHGKSMGYVLVATVALVAGLLLAGTSVQALLPFVLLLACPLMMVVMMRGMAGPGGHSHDAPPPQRTDSTVERTDSTVDRAGR